MLGHSPFAALAFWLPLLIHVSSLLNLPPLNGTAQEDTDGKRARQHKHQDIFSPRTTKRRRRRRKADSYRAPVTFYAMGDAPYSSDDRERLPEQIKSIPSDAEFVVHLGDMKGVDKCDSDGPYRLVSDAFLDGSDVPVFLVPGDNDYYDCDDWQAGWRRWSSHFLRFHQRFNKKWISRVDHQPSREENFSFKRRGVLFVGVHTLGATRGIKDDKRWRSLLKDDLEWVRGEVGRLSHRAVVIFSHAALTADHEVFKDGLSEVAEESGAPFLYLHGDTHRWIEDRPFAAKNILRVVVDQGGMADPVNVTVDWSGEEPGISFQRRSLTKMSEASI